MPDSFAFKMRQRCLIMRDKYVSSDFLWMRCPLALAWAIGLLVDLPKAAAEDAPVPAPPAATQPSAPAWIQQDPHHWPQILLRNKLTYKDRSYSFSGSSVLARLPNGVVVLCTARHLLGEGNLAGFGTDVRSWNAFSPEQPNGGVLMTRIAMDSATSAGIDALVLCPESQHELWPGAVLPIRPEPLEVGDVVYLVAVPFNDKSRQNVYKGVVISRRSENEFQYNVDGSFVTTGCSGAPVIDSSGRLAGINTGHLNDQNIPGTMQLICIDSASVLRAVKVPPDIIAARNESPASMPSTRPTSAAIAANAADRALRTAKLLMTNKMYDKARQKLQAIIDAYPDSDAANQAGQMLSNIPDSSQITP